MQSELVCSTRTLSASLMSSSQKNLKLDLTRGKPSSEQLDFADELLALPGKGDFKAADGTDVRNYGGLDGIVDIRQIWADLLGVPVEQVLAGMLRA